MDPILEGIPPDFVVRHGKKLDDIAQDDDVVHHRTPIPLMTICKRSTFKAKVKLLETPYSQFFRFMAHKVWVDDEGRNRLQGSGWSALQLDLEG
jgi:hypothetical protein